MSHGIYGQIVFGVILKESWLSEKVFSVYGNIENYYYVEHLKGNKIEYGLWDRVPTALYSSTYAAYMEERLEYFKEKGMNGFDMPIKLVNYHSASHPLYILGITKTIVYAR